MLHVSLLYTSTGDIFEPLIVANAQRLQCPNVLRIKDSMTSSVSCGDEEQGMCRNAACCVVALSVDKRNRSLAWRTRRTKTDEFSIN